MTSSGGTIETITYTYDNVGRVTKVADPFAVVTFVYDSGGRLTQAATKGGTGVGQPLVTLSYGYDPGGNRTSTTDSLTSVGRTTYQYDAADRLTTISQSFGGTNGPRVVLGYDPGNRETSIARSIGGCRYHCDLNAGVRRGRPADDLDPPGLRRLNAGQLHVHI